LGELVFLTVPGHGQVSDNHEWVEGVDALSFQSCSVGITPKVDREGGIICLARSINSNSGFRYY
jgi:hypothetical protein